MFMIRPELWTIFIRSNHLVKNKNRLDEKRYIFPVFQSGGAEVARLVWGGEFVTRLFCTYFVMLDPDPHFK